MCVSHFSLSKTMNPSSTPQHSRKLLNVMKGSALAPQPHVRPPERTISVVITIIVMAMLICTLVIHLIFTCFRRRQHSVHQSPPATSSSHSDDLAVLPTFIYAEDSVSASCSSAMASSSDSEPICAICLAEFVHGEIVRVLPRCNHMYHKECIDQWLVVRSRSCPICRDQTIDQDVEPKRSRCTHANGVGDPSMFPNL